MTDTLNGKTNKHLFPLEYMAVFEEVKKFVKQGQPVKLIFIHLMEMKKINMRYVTFLGLVKKSINVPVEQVMCNQARLEFFAAKPYVIEMLQQGHTGKYIWCCMIEKKKITMHYQTFWRYIKAFKESTEYKRIMELPCNTAKTKKKKVF